MRNKNASETSFLHTLFFCTLLHSKLFYLLLLRHRGMEWGCGQFITCCLSNSYLCKGRTPHTLPLPQHGIPPMAGNPPWTSPTRRTSCLTMVFITGCWQISSPAFGAPLHPSSPLTLACAELFSHIFLLLSLPSLAQMWCLWWAWLCPDDSDRSLLEPAGGCARYGDNFWQLLREATLAAFTLCLPKPCYIIPIEEGKKILWTYEITKQQEYSR